MATVNVIRKHSFRIKPGLKNQFDYWLLLTLAGLIVMGLLLVYSSTFDLGLRMESDSLYYIKRQFVALIMGVIGIIVFMQMDYHVLRRWSVPAMILVLVLLVYLLLFGEETFGARRTLFNDSFQPSEAAKLVTFLYIAHWLSSKGDRVKDVTYGGIPFAVITATVASLIILQPDLSTAALITLVSLILFFVAGADLRQIFGTTMLGGIIFFVLVTTVPHAAARVDDFIQTLIDPSQAHWQVQQAMVALGRGGLFGMGLGEGTQKFGPLPAAHTDGVFAILGEELGLVGTLFCISLLGVLVWRGFLTARRARDSFGGLLALGITSWIGIQALMNIAVITAVMPVTGIPLPFLSYGGSSLFVSLLGMGILLNISRDAAITQRAQPKRR